MGALELFPAVDVAGGRAVQLTQGAAGSERVFGDPLEAALRWQEAGARWVPVARRLRENGPPRCVIGRRGDA